MPQASLAVVLAEPAQDVADERRRGRLAPERRVGHDANQRSLERTNAGGHAVRDLGEHLGGTSSSSSRARLARIARRTSHLGSLELDHEPRAEALRQAVLEPGNVLGGAVGGHHELAARRPGAR